MEQEKFFSPPPLRLFLWCKNDGVSLQTGGTATPALLTHHML